MNREQTELLVDWLAVDVVDKDAIEHCENAMRSMQALAESTDWGKSARHEIRRAMSALCVLRGALAVAKAQT
jgi:hypothetical protein